MFFWQRLSRLWRRREDEADVDEELRLHLEMETDELVRTGVPRDEARRRARVAFGGMENVREQARDVRRLPWLETWTRDARYALRALRRSPAFSITRTLTVLVLGVGATTAVFTLLDRVVLRPLPFPDANRFVVVRHSAPGLGLADVGVSGGLYFFYHDRARSLERLALYSERETNVRIEGRGTERVHMTLASTALFEILGAKPVLGRLFTEDDGRPGFMNTTWPVPVLLAYDFWASRLGGDAAIVGQTITINDRARLVLGVLPREFAFPDARTQIWMMFEQPPTATRVTSGFDMNLVARLRDTVTAAEAESELKRILPEVTGRYPDATPERVVQAQLAPSVRPLKDAVIGDMARVLWTLFGGMACLLFIALANAGGLFVIRAEHRRREIALRQALGASTVQIVRLFLTEALVLAVLAAAGGLALARSLLALAVTLVPEPLPRASEIRLDVFSVVFAGVVTVLIAGFYAALSLRRQRSTSGLSAMGSGVWATGRQLGGIIRNPFVALQVALALTLLVGSALMAQTYVNLSRRPLGFTPDRLLTVPVALASGRYREFTRIYAELIERVGHLPGVVNAAATSFVPLVEGEDRFPVEPGGEPVWFKFFTPGYFDTMGTPMLEGERFSDGTPVAVERPVLISAALARRLFPGTSALGRRLVRYAADGTNSAMTRADANGTAAAPVFTVAGVVADVRETTLRDGPAEVVYIPVLDPPVESSIAPVNMTLVVRTRVPPLSLAAAARDAIASFDPSLSVGQIRAMDAIVDASRSTETFVGALLIFASGISLVLGLVGIYGSVAHEVGRRTREIGIRLSLGARRGEVVRMMLHDSAWPVLTGAIAGLALALLATQTLRSLVFGVEPADPITFIVVTAGLLLAGATAAFAAARRAAGISPILILRGE